jgi:hypothetical protein
VAFFSQNLQAFPCFEYTKKLIAASVSYREKIETFPQIERKYIGNRILLPNSISLRLNNLSEMGREKHKNVCDPEKSTMKMQLGCFIDYTFTTKTS